LSLNGAGSGVSGIALIACPELLPNKFRHIGVVLADGFVYLMIIIGPVVGCAAINHKDSRWTYIYWGGFIVSCVAFIGLFFLYCEFLLTTKYIKWLKATQVFPARLIGSQVPPKHPRGVEWTDALQGLDCVGALLFTPGAMMVLGNFTIESRRLNILTDRLHHSWQWVDQMTS
jgi:hypothetical protein